MHAMSFTPEEIFDEASHLGDSGARNEILFRRPRRPDYDPLLREGVIDLFTQSVHKGVTPHLQN